MHPRRAAVAVGAEVGLVGRRGWPGGRPRAPPGLLVDPAGRPGPAARRPGRSRRCARRTARRRPARRAPRRPPASPGRRRTREHVGHGPQPCGRLGVARPAELVVRQRARAGDGVQPGQHLQRRARQRGAQDSSSVETRTASSATSSPAPARTSSRDDADPSSTARRGRRAAATPRWSRARYAAAPGRAASRRSRHEPPRTRTALLRAPPASSARTPRSRSRADAKHAVISSVMNQDAPDPARSFGVWSTPTTAAGRPTPARPPRG